MKKALCPGCDRIKTIKAGHTKCRECFIGKEKYAEEKKRNRQRNIIRDIKSNRNRDYTCEMGYSDCEARGYCNGDC